MTDRLLTRQETAARLGVRPQTLATWAMTGRHLTMIRVGGRVRYRESDIEAFLARRTVRATDTT